MKSFFLRVILWKILVLADRIYDEDKKQFKELDIIFIWFAVRVIIEQILKLYAVTIYNNPAKYIDKYLRDERLDRLKVNGKELTNNVIFEKAKDKRLKRIYDECCAGLHTMSDLKKEIKLDDFYYVMRQFKYVLSKTYQWLAQCKIEDNREDFKEYLKGKELNRRSITNGFLQWYLGWEEDLNSVTVSQVLLQGAIEPPKM